MNLLIIYILFILYGKVCEKILFKRINSQLRVGEKIKLIVKCDFWYLYITPALISVAVVFLIIPHMYKQHILGLKGSFYICGFWLLLFITIYYMSNLQVITDKKVYSVSIFNFFKNYNKEGIYILPLEQIENIKCKYNNMIVITESNKQVKYFNTYSNQKNIFNLLMKLTQDVKGGR